MRFTALCQCQRSKPTVRNNYRSWSGRPSSILGCRRLSVINSAHPSPLSSKLLSSSGCIGLLCVGDAISADPWNQAVATALGSRPASPQLYRSNTFWRTRDWLRDFLIFANQKPEARRAREARRACRHKSHRKLACLCNQPTSKDRASNSSQISACVLQSGPTSRGLRSG
jgi:hypothetical protein